MLFMTKVNISPFFVIDMQALIIANCFAFDKKERSKPLISYEINSSCNIQFSLVGLTAQNISCSALWTSM